MHMVARDTCDMFTDSADLDGGGHARGSPTRDESYVMIGVVAQAFDFVTSGIGNCKE